MGGAALCLNLHGWRNPHRPAGACLFEFLCCCQPLVVFDSLSRYRHRLFNPAATICCLPFHIMLHNHCLLSGHWRPRQDHEGHVQVRQLVEAGSGLQPAVMKPLTNVDMATRMIGDQNERLACSNVSAAVGCAYLFQIGEKSISESSSLHKLNQASFQSSDGTRSRFKFNIVVGAREPRD